MRMPRLWRRYHLEDRHQLSPLWGKEDSHHYLGPPRKMSSCDLSPRELLGTKWASPQSLSHTSYIYMAPQTHHHRRAGNVCHVPTVWETTMVYWAVR